MQTIFIIQIIVHLLMNNLSLIMKIQAEKQQQHDNDNIGRVYSNVSVDDGNKNNTAVIMEIESNLPENNNIKTNDKNSHNTVTGIGIRNLKENRDNESELIAENIVIEQTTHSMYTIKPSQDLLATSSATELSTITVQFNNNLEHNQQHHHHHNTAIMKAAMSNENITKTSLPTLLKLPHKTLPKIQRTDAPMLNYIFDSISNANKHHHHDHRYGPHFEDVPSDGNVTNITVHVGNSVYLNCRISLLQDKTVSWVKRRPNDTNLELLTVGLHTYSGDARYKVEFQYPINWRLKIESAIKDDEGTYECQISTHPPRVIQKNLYVNDPKVLIIDEEGSPLQDKYYEVDSTMQLSCIVRHVAMTTSVVYWAHGERILNYDVNRGGVSVKTEILEKGANSTLFLAKINKSDSGNYTCSINSTHEFTVLVHVLNGESFAELHHGTSSMLQPSALFCFPIIIIAFIRVINCLLIQWNENVIFSIR